MLTKERLDELLAYDPETGIFTWRVDRSNVKAGTPTGANNGNGYLRIRVDKVQHYAHRLAFLSMVGEAPSGLIDHANGDRSDNRWCNLRPASGNQNGQNRRTQPNNTSGTPGVYWHKGAGKWMAYITVNKRPVYLGLFVDLDDAVAARRAAEAKYFGEFAPSSCRSAA